MSSSSTLVKRWGPIVRAREQKLSQSEATTPTVSVALKCKTERRMSELNDSMELNLTSYWKLVKYNQTCSNYFISTIIEILLKTNRNQHFWIKVPISSGMSNSKENANLKEREEENGFSDPRFYFHFLKSGFPLGASGKKSSLNFCFEGLQLNHCHLHNTWHDQIFNCIQRQANYAVKMIYHGLNI